jgi:transaldolase/glucose-6-phosphate isomerase
MEQNLGELAAAVRAAADELLAVDAVGRLLRKDASLWSDRPAVRSQIASSLGWLDVVEPMAAQWPALVDFAGALRRDGFTDAVVLGMGGSSLIALVWAGVLGASPGGLTLHVLDSTEPETVRSLAARLSPARTVFIVASKSGTTTEPVAFQQYFWDWVAHAGFNPAERFCALTDPGTPLAALAERDQWRRVFLNPADIGGRYSALSLFGLVPAALLGIDGRALLERARALRAELERRDAANPALALAAVLGAAVRAGRDKCTLVVSPRLGPFALWLEQLLAESTGKDGTGIIPVYEPTLGPGDSYGRDRLFVVVRLADDPPPPLPLGAPNITLVLDRPEALGAECLRWEAAVALAGRLLSINPFDQPNVQESKDHTRAMLDVFLRTGRLDMPEGAPALAAASPVLAPVLDQWLADLGPRDYLAVMAYLPYTAAVEEELRALQRALRDRTGRAVMVGYGPRFLHSTGQLFKGGPQVGRFLQVLADPERLEPVMVPGAGYSFNVLVTAQAYGDRQALVTRRRPLVTVDVGSDPVAGLARIRAALASGEEVGA